MSEQRNLTVEVRRPLWAGNALAGEPGEAYSSVGFELAANGGCISADLALSGREEALSDWLDRLGYDVTIYNPALSRVFDGFVNEVQLNVGGISLKRGPMLGVANRIRVTYQTVTYNTNPPIGGDAAETALSNHAASQALYGVLAETVSGGTGLAAEMEQLRDTILAERAYPETSQDLNVAGGGEARVQVRIAGYGALLGRYYFGQSGTGTQNVSAKLAAILAASPSVTYNTAGIETNTLQVGVYSEGDKEAAGEISDLVARGDASDNRWLFGVDPLQKARYSAVPTAVGYYHWLGDKEQRIETAEGQRVYPWDVQPGRWLLVADFLPGLGVPSNLRTDPRAIFIESVKYSTPWGLQINGGKTGKLAQKLAKMGTGGM